MWRNWLTVNLEKPSSVLLLLSLKLGSFFLFFSFFFSRGAAQQSLLESNHKSFVLKQASSLRVFSKRAEIENLSDATLKARTN